MHFSQPNLVMLSFSTASAKITLDVIYVLFIFRHAEKRPGYPGRFSDFLMRGGDSEFFNYLKYILQGKCVQSVYEF